MASEETKQEVTICLQANKTRLPLKDRWSRRTFLGYRYGHTRRIDGAKSELAEISDILDADWRKTSRYRQIRAALVSTEPARDNMRMEFET